MCEDSGISYQLPDPNNFSFNSPEVLVKNAKDLEELKKLILKKLFLTIQFQ